MKYNFCPFTYCNLCCRPPRRGTWIEIFKHNYMASGSKCRPPRRGTWIEINRNTGTMTNISVVPRVGGRGLKYPKDSAFPGFVRVVPRVGGRGLKLLTPSPESLNKLSRPPRRGTWIEIICCRLSSPYFRVVPRVGGRGLKFLRVLGRDGG